MSKFALWKKNSKVCAMMDVKNMSGCGSFLLLLAEQYKD
jgi:hypothetical protein